MKFEIQIEKSEFHFEFKAKVSKSMPKFKFWTRKTANLQEIVPPNVRSGDQLITTNLQELPTSNPPIAITYCTYFSICVALLHEQEAIRGCTYNCGQWSTPSNHNINVSHFSYLQCTI